MIGGDRMTFKESRLRSGFLITYNISLDFYVPNGYNSIIRYREARAGKETEMTYEDYRAKYGFVEFDGEEYALTDYASMSQSGAGADVTVYYICAAIDKDDAKYWVEWQIKDDITALDRWVSENLTDASAIVPKDNAYTDYISWNPEAQDGCGGFGIWEWDSMDESEMCYWDEPVDVYPQE
jgi:hypothetical protein